MISAWELYLWTRLDIFSGDSVVLMMAVMVIVAIIACGDLEYESCCKVLRKQKT